MDELINAIVRTMRAWEPIDQNVSDHEEWSVLVGALADSIVGVVPEFDRDGFVKACQWTPETASWVTGEEIAL